MITCGSIGIALPFKLSLRKPKHTPDRVRQSMNGRGYRVINHKCLPGINLATATTWRMKHLVNTAIGIALLATAAPVLADRIVQSDSADSGSGDETLPYLQCVPYARQVSGIRIYGDAWTWWDQAKDLYKRGNEPRVGAVMAFAPYGKMELGHVAAVSKIVDSRTVLLRHANWSLINGRRGQIEDDVKAVDVSPDNDWSEVRVWYAPINALGTTHWPLKGFIYPKHSKPAKFPRAAEPLKASGPDTLASSDPIATIISARLAMNR